MPYVVELPDLSYHFLLGFVRQAKTASEKVNRGAMIQSLTNALEALEKAKGHDVVHTSNPPAETPVIPAKKVIRAATKKAPEVILVCPEHPKYTAQRSPRSDCKSCWKMYAHTHPERMENRG